MIQSNDRVAREHNCSNRCVRSEMNVNLERTALFRRPILCGWKRTGRYYRTPCGVDLYSYQDISKYLTETQSKLRIDSFNLGKTIDPSTNCSPVTVKTYVSFFLHFQITLT